MAVNGRTNVGTMSSPLGPLFIAHSAKDASTVEALANALEARGLECRYAPRDFAVGAAFAAEIVYQIANCAAVLLLVSQHTVESTHVPKELAQAANHQKRILTLMMGRPRLNNEFSYHLGNLHWLDCDRVPLDGIADILKKSLQRPETWPDVAMSPGWRRDLKYHPFALKYTMLGAALTVAGTAATLYWNQHQSEARYSQDARSLGHVSATAMAGRVQLAVYLLADGASFADVRFQTRLLDRDGAAKVEDHSQLFNPTQVGSVQQIQLPLARTSTDLLSCLSVPSKGAARRLRIEQRFSIGVGDGETPVVTPTSPALVVPDDGSPCASSLKPLQP